MESHLEARLWNDIFVHTQKAVGVPQGAVRATVLIETRPADFEMDEILWELCEHSSGLNIGRWDYIFSCIKKLRSHREFCLADRAQVNSSPRRRNRGDEAAARSRQALPDDKRFATLKVAQSGMRHPVPHLRHSTRIHAACSGATAEAARPGMSSMPVATTLNVP